MLYGVIFVVGIVVGIVFAKLAGADDRSDCASNNDYIISRTEHARRQG